MKSALLVIDVQESFRQRPYWQDQELQPFLSNVQALADDCARRRIPVLQIFHC
ncbi:MAG: isochorismatase family protein, partial [Sinobacteraceae bacterium]|nr:isochorismatase family protein [Nevskiaceae bacterium]